MITIGKKRRRPIEKLLVKPLEMGFIIRQLVSNRFKLNQSHRISTYAKRSKNHEKRCNNSG
jgi:hypothetical protein